MAMPSIEAVTPSITGIFQNIIAISKLRNAVKKHVLCAGNFSTPKDTISQTIGTKAIRNKTYSFINIFPLVYTGHSKGGQWYYHLSI
ncbi:hypothetical protein SDC9_117774 [bioreactor metagenome]|uniref:Uncharacterized protein n=1 Tax=bioreactor metagenome TaxID=1076179 RepID=A0A645C656_9ZZZZ